MGTCFNSRLSNRQRTRRARVHLALQLALRGTTGMMALPACSLWHAAIPHAATASDWTTPFVEPPAPEEVSGNEEAGVAHLHALLRCFDAGVVQTQFAVAEDCLSHAERGVVRANSLTRSHPDFDDLADAVKAARQRLAQAIERDRVLKRNQAIDALIARGEVAYDHANALCMVQARPSPCADDIAELTDSRTALTGLLRQGEGFVDAPRYQSHAAQLQAALNAVSGLRAAMSWQLGLQQRLAPVIEAAFAAAAQAKAGGEAPRQLAAYKSVAQAFAQCVQMSGAAQSEPGYSPSLTIETRLGHLSLEATQAQCTSVLTQANERINRFGWEHLLTQLSDVLPVAQTHGQKAAEALAAALPLLAACSEGAPSALDAAESDTWLFASPFGALRVAALRQACAKEAQKLAPRQALLAWQARLESVGARLDAADLSFAAATQTPAPIDAVRQLAAAKGGFEECYEAAQALSREPSAQRRFQVLAGQSQRNVDAIAKRCNQQAQATERAMRQAAKELALGQFAKSCQGDESSVLAREGMPARVEPVGTGRVFVYGPHKRIAFDSFGRRTQEAALAP